MATSKEERTLSKLADAIDNLTCAIRESHSQQAILEKLAQIERNIMSAISEFAAKQATYNKRHGDAIDAAVASITGLTEDVQTLNDKITELQNSGGGVTPEDQALIDDLQTQGEAVAAKAEALATALAALDAQNPPAVPPTP